ncbi:MAG: tetratricopeptide repeat protein [Lachnospiraceae bacterium]|nr:tetratricopeptide repeat protein [Lachnospiraceae bacterium]
MGIPILCQIPRASEPWYLENIGLNIYSAEELGYFICNNLPLVDQSIVCEGLAQWVRSELKMVTLSGKLMNILQGPYTDRDFILTLLKEICYMNSRELTAFDQKLDELEKKPLAVRLKKKADTLMQHEKYTRALKYYREALVCEDQGNTGIQFRGTVYNNLGCVYARLFQMEEACECFLRAYEDLHTLHVLKSYLFSVFLKDGESEYRQKLDEFGVDEKSRVKLAREIAAVQMPDMPENLDEALRDWTDTYHRNTDM